MDSDTITIHTTDDELDSQPWTIEEKTQLLRLELKRRRVAGFVLSQALNRVIVGDEGSNVRQWSILSKDVTKTNIGTAYVNVPPGANGERSLIDFTGSTEFRIILNANLVGTGPWAAQLIRDGDSSVIFEAPNLGAAGERELDSGWQAVPGPISGLTVVRLQAKSGTATDDPVFRRCIVLTR